MPDVVVSNDTPRTAMNGSITSESGDIYDSGEHPATCGWLPWVMVSAEHRN